MTARSLDIVEHGVQYAPFMKSNTTVKAEEALLSDDFTQDPSKRGWRFVKDAKKTAGRGEWFHESPPGPCLRTTRGYWESPAFPVTPFMYYRYSFLSRTEEPAFCAAMFRDGTGATMEQDHHSSADPSGQWDRREVCFRAKEGSVEAFLRFNAIADVPFDIGRVVVGGVSREQVERWSEEIYRSVPAIGSVGDVASPDSLGRTLSTLRNGGRLRIVMLGDSILNDIGNSPFDVLLRRRYPRARIEVITSVSGSKGCWYYKEEARLQREAIRHDPDLVILGGLSERGDTESMREVISRLRECVHTEILLLSPVLGSATLYLDGEHAAVDAGGLSINEYRARLKKLSDEMSVGWFDFYAPWREYVRGCGVDYSFFMRDEVHAHERGRQVLARMLASYLSGSGAEQEPGARLQ